MVFLCGLYIGVGVEGGSGGRGGGVALEDDSKQSLIFSAFC